MKKPLGLGVSGCGAIAIQAVFMHASEPDGQNMVRLAAVCDPVPGRAKDMAEKYNIPHYYTSYVEMLADPAVDLVTLCSPSGLHYERMPWFEKMAMTIFSALMKRKKSKTSYEESLAQAIANSYDISSRDYVLPLVACLRADD